MATRITAAQMLERAIEFSGKSQKEIAHEVGYSKPNVLSMMKKGITKIPVDRAPALARACGVDEKMFLRHVMYEYMPETWKVISETLGTELLSEDEQKVLEEYRQKRDASPSSE
jgi:DNA-binding transcriptional regulator YdaS (Cro superfamily)